MYKNNMECCALSELVDITLIEKPEKVIENLCIELKRWGSTVIEDPGAFLIFSAVVNVRDDDADYDDYCDRLDRGDKLAAYIREHKLGIVTESVSRRNRVNHPRHTVKVFVWAPNYRGLQKWWTDFNTPKVKG